MCGNTVWLGEETKLFLHVKSNLSRWEDYPVLCTYKCTSKNPIAWWTQFWTIHAPNFWRFFRDYKQLWSFCKQEAISNLDNQISLTSFLIQMMHDLKRNSSIQKLFSICGKRAYYNVICTITHRDFSFTLDWMFVFLISCE